MNDLEKRRELERLVREFGGRVLYYHPKGVNAEFSYKSAALNAYMEAGLSWVRPPIWPS